MNQDTSKFRYVFTIFNDFTDEYKVKHKLMSVNDYITIDKLEKFLVENSKVWSFQQEHTQAKRLHFQGRLSLRKLTKKLLLKMFLNWFIDLYQLPIHVANHWLTLVTVLPEQDYVNSFKYTKKDESRVPGTFRCYPPIYDGRDLEVMQSDNPKYFWQEQLDKIIREKMSATDRSYLCMIQ